MSVFKTNRSARYASIALASIVLLLGALVLGQMVVGSPSLAGIAGEPDGAARVPAMNLDDSQSPRNGEALSVTMDKWLKQTSFATTLKTSSY